MIYQQLNSDVVSLTLYLIHFLIWKHSCCGRQGSAYLRWCSNPTLMPRGGLLLVFPYVPLPLFKEILYSGISLRTTKLICGMKSQDIPIFQSLNQMIYDNLRIYIEYIVIYLKYY